MDVETEATLISMAIEFHRDGVRRWSDPAREDPLGADRTTTAVAIPATRGRRSGQGIPRSSRYRFVCLVATRRATILAPSSSVFAMYPYVISDQGHNVIDNYYDRQYLAASLTGMSAGNWTQALAAIKSHSCRCKRAAVKATPISFRRRDSKTVPPASPADELCR